MAFLPNYPEPSYPWSRHFIFAMPPDPLMMTLEAMISATEGWAEGKGLTVERDPAKSVFTLCVWNKLPLCRDEEDARRAYQDKGYGGYRVGRVWIHALKWEIRFEEGHYYGYGMMAVPMKARIFVNLLEECVMDEGELHLHLDNCMTVHRNTPRMTMSSGSTMVVPAEGKGAYVRATCHLLGPALNVFGSCLLNDLHDTSSHLKLFIEEKVVRPVLKGEMELAIALLLLPPSSSSSHSSEQEEGEQNNNKDSMKEKKKGLGAIDEREEGLHRIIEEYHLDPKNQFNRLEPATIWYEVIPSPTTTLPEYSEVAEVTNPVFRERKTPTHEDEGMQRLVGIMRARSTFWLRKCVRIIVHQLRSMRYPFEIEDVAKDLPPHADSILEAVHCTLFRDH